MKDNYELREEFASIINFKPLLYILDYEEWRTIAVKEQSPCGYHGYAIKYKYLRHYPDDYFFSVSNIYIAKSYINESLRRGLNFEFTMDSNVAFKLAIMSVKFNETFNP